MIKKETQEKKNLKQQKIIYAIFIILVIIGVFIFTGEYLDMKKENSLLKGAVKENQNLAEYRLTSINQLRTELKACRGANG